MNDEQCPLFSPEVQQLIAQHRVFSGGRRHRELVADLLPAGAVWIDIIVPLSAVYQEYRALDEPVLVFASGDPLFFGFTTTLMREFPGQVAQTFPPSVLCRCLRIACAYPTMICVSSH